MTHLVSLLGECMGLLYKCKWYVLETTAKLNHWVKSTYFFSVCDSYHYFHTFNDATISSVANPLTFVQNMVLHIWFIGFVLLIVNWPNLFGTCWYTLLYLPVVVKYKILALKHMNTTIKYVIHQLLLHNLTIPNTFSWILFSVVVWNRSDTRVRMIPVIW